MKKVLSFVLVLDMILGSVSMAYQYSSNTSHKGWTTLTVSALDGLKNAEAGTSNTFAVYKAAVNEDGEATMVIIVTNK